ncbi:MAG: hypothetical protein MUO26_04675 [Methanotrichaceae archaeon]|nr:hypothetical protein [Methanotrichaceae archaeon]
MEIVISILASNVVSILAPYLAKGADVFAQEAGKAAFHKTKNLLETIKKRWSGDKEARTSLELFEEKPARYESVIEDILKEKLEHDDEFAVQLQKILYDMEPEIEIIQKMKVGENIIGLEVNEIIGGKTRVTQEVEQAKDVVGAKIKQIG